jgi:hypothetical protein
VTALDDLVASLQQVVAAVDTAIERAQQAVQVAGDAETAAASFGNQRAMAEAADLRSDCEEALAALVEARDRYAELVARAAALRDGGAAPAASGGSAPIAAPTREPRPTSDQRLRDLAAELPPPVVPRSGKKTHGRLVDHADPEHRADPVISGDDALAAKAWAMLREQGMARRGPPIVKDHAEVKAAVTMVERRTREATVVINNEVCPGPFGCQYFAERILYEGTTLWVQTPTDRVPMRGRRKRDDNA